MSILEKHKVEYGEAAQVLITVPGVVTLVGEFSDYGQGYALCGTCPKDLSIAVSKRQDSNVRVYNTQSNDKKKFALSSIKYRKEDRWGNYIKGIIIELQKISDFPGLDITLSGALLQSDGKILSAAMGVGLCKAFSRLTGVELSDEQIAKCCYVSTISFCKELTNCHLVFSILKAIEGKYMLYDMLNKTYKYVDDPFKDSKYAILLADGHIPPAAMREELYARHTQAKETMKEIARLADRGCLRGFPISEVSDRIMPLSEEDRMIGCYVFEESQIAKDMYTFFENRDFAQIGKAFNKVGKGLRDCMEITCPELDWVAKRASEVPGCIGNSIVYNGCGGYIAVVMDKLSIPTYAAKVEDYEKIFGFKLSLDNYTPMGSIQIVENPS